MADVSVDPEVLDRACDAAKGALILDVGETMNDTIRITLEAGAPVVAAAAYRQGREDGLREARELIEGRSGFEVTKEHGFERARDGYLINRPSLLDSLRSLLTDKEDNND